jgi:hypothetical protein
MPPPPSKEVRNRAYRIITLFTAAGSPSRKIRLRLVLLATGATRGLMSVATEAVKHQLRLGRVYICDRARQGRQSSGSAVARRKRTDSTHGHKVCWRRCHASLCPATCA